jgi:hypothetical protein
MRFFPMIMAVYVVGCAAESHPSEALDDDAIVVPSGPCGEGPDGAYLTGLVRLSGDCGELEGGVTVVGGASSEDLARTCRGTQTRSSDGCSVVTDMVCPFEGKSLGMRGKVTWVPGYDRGTGIVTIQPYSAQGTTLCVGTYRVTYARQ